MKLLLMLTVFSSYSSVEISAKFNYDDNAIENLYIDNLVQRYMHLESDLWNYVYNSGAKTKDIIFKIRSDHSDFFASNGLSKAMSVDNKLKFEKLLNLTGFDNYGQEDSMLMALIDQPHGTIQSGFYSTSEFIIYNYNRIVSEDLFKVIKNEAEIRNCSDINTRIIESASQDLHKFYEIITASMLISYATTQRMNMVLVVKRGFEKYDYTLLKNSFNTRYGKIASLARENIQSSSKVVWMCDPLNYTEDDDSIQITNFLTGYVDNEINLNKDGSCWKSCADYRWTKNYRCSDGTYCDGQRRIGHVSACNGTILDCSYVESTMSICQSVRIVVMITLNSIPVHDSDDNLVLPNQLKFLRGGIYSWCIVLIASVTVILIRILIDISVCNRQSQQFEKTSRTNSTIITGVGIIKRNGIFSWTIIQSQLLSNGRVQQRMHNETYDADWQYRRSNERVNDDERDEVVQDFKRNDFGIFEGVDYFTLSWQNRSINLDTITVPPGCVVTGIKFTVIKEHLNFEIRYTQFNYNTGRLYGRSEWISNKNVKRSVILLDRPEPSRPLNQFETKRRSIPDITPNKFIKFRPSDPEKDAGQTTVPFIDTQMVRPKELTLLSGVGIYYKGLPGYGGFVAPKLIMYDMSAYMGN